MKNQKKIASMLLLTSILAGCSPTPTPTATVQYQNQNQNQNQSATTTKTTLWTKGNLFLSDCINSS